MKKTKIKLRVLSAFLAFGMVFCSSVFMATAEDTLDEALTATGEASGESISVTESYFEDPDNFIPAVFEVTDRREENVKHFSMPDGTYQAVVYGDAVHRLDESGKWQDIDNRLSLIESKGLSTYSTSDGRVSFVKTTAPSSEGTMLFTLTENGYLVAMAIVGEPSNSLSADAEAVLVSSANVTNHAERAELLVTDTAEEQYNKLANIDNTTEVLYSNIVSDTDIEYTLYSNSVKENIVVKARKDSYVYNFMFAVKGLVASMMPDGSITLSDATTDETVYIIPAPYMTDANGEISHSVTYTLTEINSDMYSLTVTADEEWINADDRAFPVKIDPTLNSKGSIYDTFVTSYMPSANMGSDIFMFVSSESSALIRCASMPELPAGSSVTSATLKVYYYHSGASGMRIISAHQMNHSWSESATYNSLYSAYGSSLGASTGELSSAGAACSASITASSPDWMNFNITNAVQSWYDTPSSNYGILLKHLFGEPVYSDSTEAETIIFSSEYTSSNSPCFIIDYVDPGIADGVYAIKNEYSQTRWITVENSNVWSGVNLQQKYYSSAPTNNIASNRASLFKISRVGTSSRYIIRSMTNNSLTLGISGTEIVTKQIPAADADVATADTFWIEWTGDGYLIYPFGSSVAINMVNTSTADLSTKSISEATDTARWRFERYSGAEVYGNTVYEETEIFYVGENISLKVAIWSTKIGSNIPFVSISQSLVGTVLDYTWNSNTQILQIQPHYSESVTVSIVIRNKNGITEHYFSHPIEFLLPLEHQFYTISTFSGHMLKATANGNLDVGQKVYVDNNDYGEQIWYFEHVGDAYYNIVSQGVRDSSTYEASLALTALQNGEVVLSTLNSSANNQKWRACVEDGNIYLSSKNFPEKYFYFSTTEISLKDYKYAMEYDWLYPTDYFFDREYNTGIDDNGDIHIAIAPMSGIYADNIITEDMFDILELWEAASPKIHIYLLDEEAPDDAFIVRIYLNRILKLNEKGEEILGTGGGRTHYLFDETDLDDSWDYGEINLYLPDEGVIMQTTDLQLRNTYIKMVLLHEMGHILKLKHPFESGYGTNESQNVILSVMNQNLYTTNASVTLAPSALDLYMVREKWGLNQ